MPDVVRRVIAASKRPAQARRKHELGDNLPMRWSEEYDDLGEEAFTSRRRSREEALAARRRVGVVIML